MLTKPNLMLGVLLGLIGCGTSPNDASSTVRHVPAVSSADCQATVRRFLEWYYQNQERLPTHLVLRYPKEVAAAFEVPAVHVSSSGRYELDEAGLKQYIGILDSTGFFSASFLAAKKQELTRKARRLASFRPAEGPPPGFDADMLLYTQEIYEPEDISNLRTQAATSSGQPPFIVLPIMERQWTFTMEQNPNTCVISAITFQ